MEKVRRRKNTLTINTFRYEKRPENHIDKYYILKENRTYEEKKRSNYCKARRNGIIGNAKL